MKFLVLGLLTTISLVATPEPFVTGAPVVKIWPGVAPGSEGKTAPERWIEGGSPDAFHRVTDIHVPTLTVYLPAKENSTGAAVIIAPGGAHRYLVVDLEGESVANKLNAMGCAAFVLKSRLSRADGSTYRAEVESLADLQQAIRVVRSRAGDWGVNPTRVGVMGFSAGGYLTALAVNQFDASTRPDFAVLAYPGGVSAQTPIAHNAPPLFMFVNDDDPLADGVAEYYAALRRAHVATEFHVFRRGGHGVGATGRGPGFEQLGVSKWPELLSVWMTDLGLLR
jgi:acetyl esterase/lipase